MSRPSVVRWIYARVRGSRDRRRRRLKSVGQNTGDDVVAVLVPVMVVAVVQHLTRFVRTQRAEQVDRFEADAFGQALDIADEMRHCRCLRHLGKIVRM